MSHHRKSSIAGRKAARRSAELHRELIRLKVHVIVTSGTPQVVAAMQSYSGYPIVFAATADPIGTPASSASSRAAGRQRHRLSPRPTDLAQAPRLLREVVPGSAGLRSWQCHYARRRAGVGEFHAAAGVLVARAILSEIRVPRIFRPLRGGLSRVTRSALYRARSGRALQPGSASTPWHSLRDCPTMPAFRVTSKPESHVLWSELPGPVPPFVADLVDKVLRERSRRSAVRSRRSSSWSAISRLAKVARLVTLEAFPVARRRGDLISVFCCRHHSGVCTAFGLGVTSDLSSLNPVKRTRRIAIRAPH